MIRRLKPTHQPRRADPRDAPVWFSLSKKVVAETRHMATRLMVTPSHMCLSSRSFSTNA